MSNRILVAIPCFNEEASISDVIIDLRRIEQIDICVVNDGSTDRTLEIVREIKGIKLINFQVNLGISEALRVAASTCLHETYSALIQCDGDGQHDSRAIIRLIERAYELSLSGESDFVIVGSRFTTGYKTSESTTVLRILGSRILRMMLYILYRLKSTDPTSGLRLYSGKSIDYLFTNYPTIWPETIFLGRLRKTSFPVYEVQVSMNERTGGESKLNGLKSVSFMVKVCLALIVDKFFWKNKNDYIRSQK
jgi:glycosyltransferase involved in cell wall biosynthesis